MMELPDLEIMTGPIRGDKRAIILLGWTSPNGREIRKTGVVTLQKKHSPVLSAQQTRFLVHVADRAEVACDDLKFCILPHVVPRHLEHAQVEVRDRAEGPAGDEHDGCFLRVPERPREPVVGEDVIWWVCKGPLHAVRAGRGRHPRRVVEWESPGKSPMLFPIPSFPTPGLLRLPDSEP